MVVASALDWFNTATAIRNRMSGMRIRLAKLKNKIKIKVQTLYVGWKPAKPSNSFITLFSCHLLPTVV
jgi:hypothetical protein